MSIFTARLVMFLTRNAPGGLKKEDFKTTQMRLQFNIAKKLQYSHLI